MKNELWLSINWLWCFVTPEPEEANQKPQQQFWKLVHNAPISRARDVPKQQSRMQRI